MAASRANAGYRRDQSEVDRRQAMRERAALADGTKGGITLTDGGLTWTVTSVDATDATGIGTIAAQDANAVAITGGTITGMGTPSASSDVATKGYVDSVSGGGGSVTTGTATIDFGAWPGSAEASVAVTGQASILAASQVSVWLSSSSTSGTHTASDHRYAAALIGLSVSPASVGDGFTVYARCLDAMQGTFSVSWRWS